MSWDSGAGQVVMVSALVDSVRSFAAGRSTLVAGWRRHKAASAAGSVLWELGMANSGSHRTKSVALVPASLGAKWDLANSRTALPPNWRQLGELRRQMRDLNTPQHTARQPQCAVVCPSFDDFGTTPAKEKY